MDIEIHLSEKPRLACYNYVGIKKSFHEDLNNKIKRFVGKNDVVTENKNKMPPTRLKEYF